MSNPDATSGANPLGRGFRSLASALIFVLAALGIWILAALPAEPPPSPEGTALFRKAEDIGVLLLVAAALIAGLPPLDRLRGKVRPGALDVVIILPAAILAVAFVADRALATKTAMLGGERHFWLDDDVMISMRYALNFASGRGLVWNAGETPVEGYSNFLWTSSRSPTPPTAGSAFLCDSLPRSSSPLTRFCRSGC
jgi:hypothetical protein